MKERDNMDFASYVANVKRERPTDFLTKTFLAEVDKALNILEAGAAQTVNEWDDRFIIWLRQELRMPKIVEQPQDEE